jgi:uncharacterized membrane protein YeaQ/YmgE (transglycosylase-associated protein family)
VINIEQPAPLRFSYSASSACFLRIVQIRKTKVARTVSFQLSPSMFYSIWLLAAAVAGWAAGKITGNDGFGTGADLLLGITGAFLVRWSVENVGISLATVYLLLFSIWGAAALPALVTLGMRRYKRMKTQSRLQND